MQKVNMLVTNRAYMLLLCAALFRFAGGYSLGFWAKQYFSGVYPDYNDEYTTLYFLILIFGGIPSELLGGYICDKYEPKYPSIKGFISAAGAFLGSICIIFCFLIPSNFYL
jgi:sugar phosphate permease